MGKAANQIIVAAAHAAVDVVVPIVIAAVAKGASKAIKK